METLILENIHSNLLKTVLEEIVSLTHLSSLVIDPINGAEDANDLFPQIFRLSVLKYCKVSFENHYRHSHGLLPFATDKYSSIEQLGINHTISVHVFQLR